jgi:hypothetical protein
MTRPTVLRHPSLRRRALKLRLVALYLHVDEIDQPRSESPPATVSALQVLSSPPPKYAAADPPPAQPTALEQDR